MALKAADASSLDLIWEAEEIARLIGRTPTQTFHMLRTGQLPGKKIGRRWVAERGALKRFFTMETATGAQPASTTPAAAES